MLTEKFSWRGVAVAPATAESVDAPRMAEPCAATIPLALPVNVKRGINVQEKMKSLFGKLGSNYEAVALTFPQLDIEKVKAKFRLKDEAALRGKADIPPSNATHFDDIEQKIISKINEEVKSATEHYYDHLRSFEERINRLHAAGHSGTLENIAITAEGDFDALVQRDATSLYTARAAVTARESDLEKFKQDNDLSRSARYPESRFLYIAVATLLISVETGINGVFFAQGHELGLLGGGFNALIPSVLNVLAGYALGNFAFRLAIHKHALKKVAGRFLCLLIPALVFALNLLVAHWRASMMDIAEGGSAEAAKTAITNFLAAPFHLPDVESWLLLATGCFFSMIATYDFWKMDDPYLHFGEITRDHDDKLHHYAHLKEDSLDELADLRDDSLEKMEEASNLINAKVNEANAVVDSQGRWKLLFADHLNYLESAGRELLAYYRTNNMTKRKAPPPAYFLEQWALDRPSLPEVGVDFMQVLKGFQAETVGLKEAYSTCTNRIGEAYKVAVKKYQTIEQLQPEELKIWLKEGAAAEGKDGLAEAA